MPTPIHSTAPSPSARSRARRRNGREKKTTKAAWSWKKAKNLPSARSPHLARSAAVLRLGEHPVEEQVQAQAQAPDRRERGRQRAMRRVAVREERVDDREARDPEGPGDVDDARVPGAQLDGPEDRHRAGGDRRAEDEQERVRVGHGPPRAGPRQVSR
jgi:hypothetical protein